MVSRANWKLVDSSPRSQCPVWPSWNQRWAHPGQQQGRRFPSLRLEQPHSIRRLLVSAFLADSIQHIHSLRASGVMSSHVVNACGSDVSAFLKSAGTSCTTPLEIFFCDIDKLSLRKPQGRGDLLLSKGCGSFGHLASPDAQVNPARDYPLRSCDALHGNNTETTYRNGAIPIHGNGAGNALASWRAASGERGRAGL